MRSQAVLPRRSRRLSFIWRPQSASPSSNVTHPLRAEGGLIVDAADDLDAVEREVIEKGLVQQVSMVGHCAQTGGDLDRQIVGLDTIDGDHHAQWPVLLVG